MSIKAIFKTLATAVLVVMLLVLMLPVAVFAAPLAPANLAATVAPGPVVNLTWIDVAGEVGYRVFRALAPSTTFVHITAATNGLAADSVSFSDTTVTAGATYSYRVVAFDSLNAESPPSNTVTITATIPAAPSALTATQQAGPPQTVTLTWTDNSPNEIGFKIERADNAAFTTNLVQNVRVANVAVAPVTFIDVDIIPGATYFYRVSALGPSGASAPTTAATITVAAAVGMVAAPAVPVAGFPQPNGFPLYYQDTLGTKLGMLPIDPAAVAGPDILPDGVLVANDPRFTSPPTAQQIDYSGALGFGTEAFYYLASAESTGFNLGTPVLLEFAIEAIFATGLPDGAAQPGQETVMNRTRVRFDVPVTGTYTITTPYHQGANALVFNGTAGSDGFDINETIDIGGLAGRDFATALTGPVNVFLRPTTAQVGGFFGDALTAGTVTGGPGGVNSVTVTGPVSSFTTNQWVIAGKILSAPVVPSFTKSLSPPLGAAFVSTSAGNPTSRLWDFGDGGSSILADPVHLYAAAGNYVVKLTASNAGGSASASQMVSLFTAPSATFTTAAGATQLTVDFTSSTAGNPTGWLWNFGDGTTSTLQNPSHTYAAGGVFNVTLSVFNPAGTATSPPQQLVVGPPLVPTNVTATVVSTTQINLSFVDNALNETGFRIDRAENNLFTGPTLLTRNLTTASAGQGLTVTFNDTANITTNKAFFYRVFAVNATSSSEASATAQATVGSAPLNKPVLTATLLSSTQIKLDWTDPNTNEDFQHLHRDTVATFNSPNFTDIVLSPNTITLTDTVTAGQTFFYFVHAMNNLGESPNSDTVQISTTIPDPPATLNGGVASPTSIVLNWSAATSASGYKVERSVGTGNTTFTLLPAGTLGNVITFTDTTVSVGNVFNYRVFATNVIGPSATASPPATVNMSAPAAPVLDPATAQANGQVVLAWNNVADETGYSVARSSDNGTTFTVLATVAANIVTYTDSAAAPETVYQYKVTAVNGLGTTASNTVAVTSATPTVAPTAPTILNATASAYNNVNLSWTDNSLNEAGFRIERSPNTTTFTLLPGLPGVNVTTFSDTSVAASTTYVYRVFAFNTSGNSTAAVSQAVTTQAAPVTDTGGGGFFGGFIPSPPVNLTTTGLTGTIATDTSGVAQAAAELKTGDGGVKLNIANGTSLKTNTGARLPSVSVSAITSPPAPPVDSAIAAAYEFGPSGSTFSPAITITIAYTAGMLPAGAVEDDLVIAFHDGSQWVNVASTVNKQAKTVSANVTHFTPFGLIYHLPPPAVTINSPAEGAALEAGNIPVSVTVENFELVAPGAANAEGQGHIHYYLDVAIPTTAGQPAFTAVGTYKASPGTTVTWENVAAGSHTLGVQLVNSDHTPLEPAVTTQVTVTVTAPLPPPPPPTPPTVTITAPAQGATLQPGNIPVTVTVNNFELVAPGGASVAGQGHIHYYLDVTIPTTAGQPAFTAVGTYKASPGTTVTWENVAAGSHTLGVQLVNNNHTPLEPAVTAQVTVNVEAPALQPAPEETTTTAVPTPGAGLEEPVSETNWGLTIGIIAAIVVVVAGLALFLMRRKAASS